MRRVEGRGECEEVRAASIFSPVLEGSAQGRSCRALGRSMGPFAHLTGVVVAWRDQFFTLSHCDPASWAPLFGWAPAL